MLHTAAKRRFASPIRNDSQFAELNGDPFSGAKLGKLLQAGGDREIQTEVKTFHLDTCHLDTGHLDTGHLDTGHLDTGHLVNGRAGDRAKFRSYWAELFLRGASDLVAAGKIDEATVEGMRRELSDVGRDPHAAFFYSFVQARALA